MIPTNESAARSGELAASKSPPVVRPGSRWPQAVLVAGAVVAVVYPIPFQLAGYTYFQTVGFLVLITAMLGVGWNIVGGWAGQFDFGPQVFFATGAYTSVLMVIHFGMNPWLSIGVGMVVTAIICGLITYPLTKLRGHYFAISSIAIWMIFVPIGQTWEFINGAQGLFVPVIPAQSLLDQVLNLQFKGRTKEMGYYYVSLVLFIAVLYVARVIQYSKFGYYFRAVRDDEDAALAIGINGRVYRAVARCMSASGFAIGGGVFAFWALAVFPDQVLNIDWATYPTISVILGGLSYLWGPVLGALILMPLAQVVSTTLGTGPLAGRGIDLILYGIIIMLVAALRPTGLLSLPWAAGARRALALFGRRDRGVAQNIADPER